VIALFVGACSSSGGPAVRAPAFPGYTPARMIDLFGPDEIPVIDAPRYEPAVGATWLADDAPVLVVQIGDRVRGYPLAVLARRQVVNDSLGGVAIVVAYSPLCDAATVFLREARGPSAIPGLSFGSAGKLYESDLVLYDRQTRSLWLQFTGDAVAGELRGAHLDPVPSTIVDLATFRTDHPGAEVVSAPGSIESPYRGYETRSAPLKDFFFGVLDRRLPAMRRVAGLRAGHETQAFPYPALGAAGDIAMTSKTVGTEDVVVFWRAAVASGLDPSRRAGVANVFTPFAAGKRLSFTVAKGAIVDRETGSEWSPSGIATAGPLQGRALPPVPHVDSFWFAWATFAPATGVVN